MSQHAEWLSLIEISGPFLAVPVLKEVYPQGFEELNGHKRKRLRQAYDEWREAWDLDDPQFSKLHNAWIEEVLARGLELDEDGEGDVLVSKDSLPESLKVLLPEYDLAITPSYAVVDEQKKNQPLLLIQTYDAETDLEGVLKGDGWAASPAERMVCLCRATGCRLGLVTNGERWMLVDAPVGAVTTFASWYARLWSQEPITLQAFVGLLSIRRFFLDKSEQLPALLDRSLKHQDEVTDALGEQVRRAVEVLVQALDRADIDRNRDLLGDVLPAELYEAGLTVMMRLVFLLCAEERGLLLMGEERYEANYAISTLRMQLRVESEEILERRMDAWARLLAVFRAVYGGIDHENLHMPALGGSLFDPDRFPFLEGRVKDTSWVTDEAKSLPIDNRTVMLLLDAIQSFEGRTLSYRALDVEQIGYVYEGLLERTVKRTQEVTLELDATKGAKNPWITISEIDEATIAKDRRFEELLRERTGSSSSRVQNDLNRKVDDNQAEQLLTACQGDQKLRDQLKPLYHLLRFDPWGYPLVYPQNAFIVITGTNRRETGTHYTPKSHTEAIVKETLEPVAYSGAGEGKERKYWQLKSADEILDLKICDPAMGSGAFLVEACRWLSERLLEAWQQVERQGKVITIDGEILCSLGSKQPMPSDSEERLLMARRLIAERCIYGVDLNPLAVELAKLSIWLVTLAKGRPFGFLDHNFRHGDSLLGITSLDQLYCLDMMPGKGSGRKLFAQKIHQVVSEAINIRKELRNIPIRDIHDVEFMARLDSQARQKLMYLELIADGLVGETLKATSKNIDTTLLSIEAGGVMEGNVENVNSLERRARNGLNADLPTGKTTRKPLHWTLEFPEVFERENGGFDALIGNPPFIYGKNITKDLGGKYNDYLCFINDGASKNSDISAHFLVKSSEILRENSPMGFVTTSSICEGETREAGLIKVMKCGSIYRASSKAPWPGSANVFIALVWFYKGTWVGPSTLDSQLVPTINSYLTTSESEWELAPLEENKGIATRGVIPNGKGFLLKATAAKKLLDEDPRLKDVLFPYLVGDDLNKSSNQVASRYIINFWDWPIHDAQKYEKVFEIVEKEVKPHRATLSEQKKKVKDNWWIYEAVGKDMFCSIGTAKFKQIKKLRSPKLEEVIVIARTSKTGAFALVDANQVFAEVTVFASDDLALFGVLQSTPHLVFAWEQAGKMKDDLRYSPSLCFLPFPLPKFAKEKEAFSEKVSTYLNLRGKILRERGLGLTAFYKLYHDGMCQDDDIVEVRNNQIELDNYVYKLYSWDIDLNYGFHEVSYLPEGKNTRFTVSESSRKDILFRLSMLNKERHEEKMLRGLLGAKSSSGVIAPKQKSRLHKVKQDNKAYLLPTQSDQEVLQVAEDVSQLDLFAKGPQAKQGEEVSTENYWVGAEADLILEWLEDHDGWFSKQVIMSGCGVASDKWSSAIDELLKNDTIEVRGQNDGQKFRIKM